ncbi:MAG: 30S ribosomal protein S7 [Candidatus Kerfeldbacteria bacterium]|nr:30S ribosomal protein S7 [Candidatus Kerfeldbacteria bacterium]
MRGKSAPKRSILPDPVYNNTALAKFMNYIMVNGKKTIARAVVYGAFKYIEDKSGEKGLDVFDKAMRNVSPLVEVRARRIGGANYQVPVEVKGDRRFNLASRWLIQAARSRKGKPMREKLALELMDAAQNQGDAVKKRQDVHRMAESNRAFAHFA